MNPSSLRSSASRTLSFEAGMSHFSCSARLAFRTRVSMSAMGSVTVAISRPFSLPSPGGLDHARTLAPQRQAPEADTAELELPQIAPGPAAQPAAGVAAHLELRRPLLLVDQRGLRHGALSLPERNAQVRQQCPGLLVGTGRRADDHVHPADLVHLVVDDLGE